MKNLHNRFSSLNKVFLFSISIIFSLFCFFVFITYFNIPELKRDMDFPVLLTPFFVFLIVLFKSKIIRFKKINLSKTSIVLILLAGCFLIKFLWVFNFRIEPLLDYETFHNLALNLKQNASIRDARYVALFPHIFGYSFFLSKVFTLFGTGELVAPLTNVILTCISMLLIFHVSYNISGLRAAVVSSLLWIFLPSQTIYNMFSLSEPLYTTLLLLAWLIGTSFFKRCDTLSVYKSGILAVIAGLALGYADAARPIALIVILSFFICFFVFRFNDTNFKKRLKNKATFFIITLIVFFGFNSTFNLYIEKTLDQEIASVPGTTLYFGFNQDSAGQWNKEDASVLSYKDIENSKKNKSANETQKEMIELLKKRISSETIDYSELMFDKFGRLWSHDVGAVSYIDSSVPDRDKEILIMISNAFYYSIVILALLNAIKLMFRREFNPLLIFMLFVIGLTLAHSVVEVAPRYHYSAMPPLIIIASFIFKNRSSLIEGSF